MEQNPTQDRPASVKNLLSDPLVNQQFVIENGLRNRWFTHWKLWFSYMFHSFCMCTSGYCGSTKPIAMAQDLSIWSSSSYSNGTLQSGRASRAILGWDLTKWRGMEMKLSICESKIWICPSDKILLQEQTKHNEPKWTQKMLARCDELLALLDEDIECESFSPFYPHMKDRTTCNFPCQLDIWLSDVVCNSLTLHDISWPFKSVLFWNFSKYLWLASKSWLRINTVVLSRTPFTHDLSHRICSGNFGYSMPYQDQNASRCARWKSAERRSSVSAGQVVKICEIFAKFCQSQSLAFPK